MVGWAVAIVALALALVLVNAGRASASGRERRRLARIERQVQLIMDHLGVVESLPNVVAELDRGRRVQAIKAYREATGAGLGEAKAAVDAMARERGLQP
jgi:ribosomal protein L7/L12